MGGDFCLEVFAKLVNKDLAVGVCVQGGALVEAISVN